MHTDTRQKGSHTMRITVVGATGQVGREVVELLTAAGHDVVAASRETGADVLTGAGLAEALAGAEVLVDVVNSPSFEDEPVMAFFSASAANLTSAAAAAGVGHYVALSIVGVDEVRVPDALIQPIAAADVSAEVARAATAHPIDGVIDIGGPEKISFADLARAVFAKQGADTPVVVDSAATYFGTVVGQNDLVTGDGATLAHTRFADSPALR